MTISYVASATADFTTSNSAVVSKPTGTAAGDLLLVHLFAPFPLGEWVTNFSYQEPRVLTAPDGDWWVVHASYANFEQITGPAPDFFTAYRQELSIVLAKIAGSSEPSSYTFTLVTNSATTGLPNGNTTTGALGISAWRGVHATSPIVSFCDKPNTQPEFSTPITDTSGQTTQPMSIPVSTGLAVLAYGCHWVLTGLHTPGAITDPSGSTNRYARSQSTNNTGGLSLASTAVSGGAVPAYTWAITTNPDNSTIQIGHVIVLRDAADTQTATWTTVATGWGAVNEAPSVQFQNDDPASIWTAELNFSSEWGDDFVIKRYTTTDGLEAASYSIENGNPNYATVDNAASLNVVTNDCPAESMYYSTYGTNEDSASYVWRLDAADLTLQAQSADLADAPRALRTGRTGTWSEQLIFTNHYGLGPANDVTNIMFRALDKTTLVEQQQLLLGAFFTAGELFDGVNYAACDFGNIDTDANGDVWMGVAYTPPSASPYPTYMLFKIDSTYTVTRYDLTTTFNPTLSNFVTIGRASVGYDGATGYLLLAGGDTYNYGPGGFGGASKLLVLWDPATTSVVGSFTSAYTEPSSPVSGYLGVSTGFLAEIQPGLTSDGANSSSPSVWVSAEAFVSPFAYAWLTEVGIPDLSPLQTLTLPAPFAWTTGAVLDVSVAPNRLWAWMYRFTPDDLASGAFSFSNHPDSESAVFGYLTLTGTATYSGTACGTPPAPPVLTCWEQDETIITLHGTDLAHVTSVMVSPSNNPYDGGAYHAPILAKSDTEIVVSILTNSLVFGWWFVKNTGGDWSAATNSPCTPLQLGSQTAWKTRRVWFDQLEP